jgi:predicted TIM-barrel fold metal-dependent hydrolase
VHLGDNAEARTWARKVNEFVADVVRERPGSFGLFATLTLPDVDGALAEAAYAFDELDADGVVLLTNVAGTYLGDPSFEPLFAELGRPLAPALASAAELLREFYFDVALSSGPSALPSLLGFADPARITYGSDYPYAPAEIAAGFGHSYERYPIEADLRRAIDRGNAEALFPRLTSVQS